MNTQKIIPSLPYFDHNIISGHINTNTPPTFYVSFFSKGVSFLLKQLLHPFAQGSASLSPEDILHYIEALSETVARSNYYK